MKRPVYHTRKTQARKGLTIRIYDPNIRKNHKRQGPVGKVYTKQEIMEFADSRGLEVSDSVYTRKV